jgi:hypothetical protein
MAWRTRLVDRSLVLIILKVFWSTGLVNGPLVLILIVLKVNWLLNSIFKRVRGFRFSLSWLMLLVYALKLSVILRSVVLRLL